ncbi:MAG: sulfatase-like hydrolase/transferase [Acidobacteriota bacterium]
MVKRTAQLMVLLVIAGCGSAGDKTAPTAAPEPPKNVLLISVDTLRADYLGCYGAANARTETFDELARQGALFEAAISPAPITLPAHASMLTGLNPWRLGIRHNLLYKLEDRFDTIAERLSSTGFRTGAVVAGYPLVKASGLSQGFAQYDDAITIKGDDVYEMPFRRASDVVDHALTWLQQDNTKPFFLFLHFYDPHDPYDPPAEYLSPDADGIAAYKGEIAYVDDQLERLFAALRASGRFDQTLVIVTADHGEGLMTHGELTHGVFLYDETIRVPLLVRYPGAIAGGKRIPDVVGTVDFAATIADALGQPVPDPTDGKSWWGLARGVASTGHEAVFSESHFSQIEFGWAPLASARSRAFKFIQAPRSELYHIESDRDERTNLVEQDKAVAQRLASLLSDARVDQAADLPHSVSEEELDRLRSLGYFQGAKGPGQAADAAAVVGRELPDPKDRIKKQAELQLASFDLSRGQFVQAETRLRVIVNSDPGNITARCRLADARAAQNDLDDAAKILTETLALGDAAATSQALWRLAGLQRRLGRYDKAISLYREYATVIPPTDRVAKALARTLEQAGRKTEADALLATWERTGHL